MCSCTCIACYCGFRRNVALSGMFRGVFLGLNPSTMTHRPREPAGLYLYSLFPVKPPSPTSKPMNGSCQSVSCWTLRSTTNLLRSPLWQVYSGDQLSSNSGMDIIFSFSEVLLQNGPWQWNGPFIQPDDLVTHIKRVRRVQQCFRRM